jgi:hypothetical protein
LSALVAGLDALGAPWAVIGGIAVVARGVRRNTNDIDAVVRGDATNPAAVIRALARHRLVPRWNDAEILASSNQLLPMRHASGVTVDVSFGWTVFEHGVTERCTATDVFGVTAPVATADDLVVFKAIAGRGKDLDDIEALLDLYPTIDRRRVRREVAALAELAEDPEPVRRLDTLLGAPARKPRRKR